ATAHTATPTIPRPLIEPPFLSPFRRSGRLLFAATLRLYGPRGDGKRRVPIPSRTSSQGLDDGDADARRERRDGAVGRCRRNSYRGRNATCPGGLPTAEATRVALPHVVT